MPTPYFPFAPLRPSLLIPRPHYCPGFLLSGTSLSHHDCPGIPSHYLSLSTLPFYSHCPQTLAASSLDNYNSILANLLLVPPTIDCCHSNLPKTPLNHAKPLIKNLHYLFITTRMGSKRLSFLPYSGLNPHFQLTAHSFPASTDSTKAHLVTPFIHLERFSGSVEISDWPLKLLSSPFAFCMTSFLDN